MTRGTMHPEVYRALVEWAKDFIDKHDNSWLHRFWFRHVVGYSEDDVEYFRYLAGLELPKPRPMEKWD